MSVYGDHLTIEEAAARRGCSSTTIWRHIREGRLNKQRIFGRVVVPVEEVDALPGPDGGGRWARAAGTSTEALATRGPGGRPPAGGGDEGDDAA